MNKDLFHPYADKSKAYQELNLDPTIRYIGCVSRIDVGKGWNTTFKQLQKLNNKRPLLTNTYTLEAERRSCI
ncbi:hypothetical protein ABFY54_00490 [Priestia megaterium]|uniref:hypothetical protein n=1 Tax=Priestia megaterium TaxID=1404 RepID=UPI003D27B997